MIDKQSWCNARKIPLGERDEEWLVLLYTISMQLKQDDLSAAQKVECRKQVRKILQAQRQRCQQTLAQHEIHHVLPIFTRVEQIFEHLALTQKTEVPQETDLEAQKKQRLEAARKDKANHELRRREQEAYQEKWEIKLTEIAQSFPPGETIELPSKPYKPEDVGNFLRQSKQLIRRSKMFDLFLVMGVGSGVFIGLLWSGGKYDWKTLLCAILGVVVSNLLWRVFARYK